jgi:hypothetical protein
MPSFEWLYREEDAAAEKETGESMVPKGKA